MSLVTVDEKHRVLLGKDLRSKAGLAKGERLVAIPFHGGVILLSLKGRSFKESLPGFGYIEEQHEASRFLLQGRS